MVAKIQLTTDGFRSYLVAVGATFDPENIDFAQLQKQYGQSYEGTRGSAERRYSPADLYPSGGFWALDFWRSVRRHIISARASR
jgi:hypothetical protein